MNIDVEKLSEELTASNQIIEVFNSASMKASEVPDAGGNSGSYRVNILQNLELCASDIANAASKLRTIIQEMRDANRKSEESVGFLNGLFNFFMETMRTNSAMQQQSDLQNAAALAGLFDDELANSLLNAANEQGKAAIEASNNARKEGIRLGATVANGFTALVKGIVSAGEISFDGMLMLGAAMAYNEAAGDTWMYILDKNTYENNLMFQEDAITGTMEIIEQGWTEEKFAKLYENEIMNAINSEAYVKKRR